MRFGSWVELFEAFGISMLGNTANGHVIGLEAPEADRCRRVLDGTLDGAEIGRANALLFDHLERGGFFEEAGLRRRLRSAYLHITQRCNLDCVGCYSLDEFRNVLDDPPLASVDRALGELAAAGAMSVNLSGGEPFLRADLPEIVRIAHEEHGIPSVNVLTNGTALDRCDLRLLAPHVECVSVSFDGCSASSPAYVRGVQRFDELVAGVKRLRSAGLRVCLLPTIHSRNIDDLASYARLAAELDAAVGFSLLSCPTGCEGLGALAFSEADLARLARTLDSLRHAGIRIEDAPVGAGLVAKRACGAGSTLVSIDARGEVYPCHMLHGVEYSMGNVFVEPLAAILDGAMARLFGTLDSADFSACASCDIRPLCGGGCRARAASHFHDLRQKDPYCSLIKEHYRLFGERLTAQLSERR